MERQETSFASLQSSDVEIEVEAFQGVKGNLPKKPYSRHFIGYNRDTMRVTFICHIRIILETLPFLESLPPNASNTPPIFFLQVQGTTKVADPWMEKASAAAKSLTKFHRFREVRLNRLDSIDLHLHLPSYPSSSIMLHDFHPSFQFLAVYIYILYMHTNDHYCSVFGVRAPSQASVPRHHSKHSWSDAIDWEDLRPGEIAASGEPKNQRKTNIYI